MIKAGKINIKEFEQECVSSIIRALILLRMVDEAKKEGLTLAFVRSNDKYTG